MCTHCGLTGRSPARVGRLVALCVAAALAPPRPAQAHPVPRGSHDRNVTVRLAADGVTVLYHLELDRWTLIFEDLPRVEDRVPVGKLSEPHELYGAFTRTAAADLAAGLRATLDGRPLTFVCVRQEHADRDSVQCDFQFRAAWELGAGRPHAFAFRDGTYEKRPGLLKLSLEPAPSVRLTDKSDPDEALQSRPEKGLSEAEWERLRSATARVEASPEGARLDSEAGAFSAEGGSRDGEDAGLVRLFLRSRQGPWLLLLLSAGLGAAHALTPGHGKTLVAAYLVGERGTTLHAVVLGLVTTLTHTGVVLVLALVLRLCFPGGMDAATRQGLHRALELVGGLLIAGLGLWLLLRRLAGQADHVHIGGGHHHHHGPGGHHHHHHPTPERVGWWGLITLGISGGIVPCWDAVALLLAALALNLLWWALPMLLAFSAGLAGVLVLIGLLVVHTRALAGARFENSRLFRALPLCSAAAVTGLGLWLCYSSLHAG